MSEKEREGWNRAKERERERERKREMEIDRRGGLYLDYKVTINKHFFPRLFLPVT